MKPKDVEMIYFVAIIQSLRDYIDEFNIQADPVFRQKTKVSPKYNDCGFGRSN